MPRTFLEGHLRNVYQRLPLRKELLGVGRKQITLFCFRLFAFFVKILHYLFNIEKVIYI